MIDKCENGTEKENMLADFIDMIYKKIVPSCIIVSRSSADAKSVVQRKAEEYYKNTHTILTSGNIKSTNLHALLYKHRKKNNVIVLDTTDTTILKSHINLSILRSAIKTLPLHKNRMYRKICYMTGANRKIPTEFEFESGLIILSDKIPKSSFLKVESICYQLPCK